MARDRAEQGANLEAREGGREPEGSQALDGGKKARFGRMGSSRHPVTSRLGFGAHLVRLLLACSLVGLAVGLPGEAPWGNTWSDAGGVLATSFAPLSLFYTCTVRNTTYSTMSACNAACDMARCYERQETLVPPSITAAGGAGFMSVSKISPGVMIGQTLEFTVKGVEGAGIMNITVMEDPGLPVGMTATSMASGTQLRLSWSPRAAQQGMIHELVIIGSKAGVSAYPWRFRIPVAPPAFSWITPGEEGGMATAVVGSPSSVTLKCHSNYPSEITVAKGYTLPIGMVLAAAGPTSRTYINGQLGAYPGATSQVIYTPPGMTDGTFSETCFDCTVLGSSQRRCVTFTVDLCKYTTKPGDSLTSVSRTLFSQSNWRRLWNVNSYLPADPQKLLKAGSIVSLGPVYVVNPGDTVDSIAGKFHSTAKNILTLNPYIADGGLQAGRGVCVPTCTSNPSPSMDYIQPY